MAVSGKLVTLGNHPKDSPFALESGLLQFLPVKAFFISQYGGMLIERKQRCAI